ncbi:hypothetical protein [Agromyces sp. ZXT2-6]|uniref:hypothetical protein n=1 Tax=Agromyces sp. ZXT2-6 TaxID=3461153 RepID=UPI004054F925
MSRVARGDLSGDFDRRFAAALATATNDAQARRAAEIDTIGIDAVARLAMAPIWTSAVLDASGLAPAAALNALSAAGLMVQTGDRYVVPEEQARNVLTDPLVAGAPLTILEHHLRAVADAVQEAQRAHVEVPAALDRFARLTSEAPSPDAVADRLIELVEAAIAEGELAEAVNWIEGAARLELTLGRELTGARLRAGRLVARKRRDEEITIFSAGYFPRKRYQAQLLSLLADSSPLWALHLRGDGGTGKTMLVRWLESRFPSDGSAGSVARIDFDYLHPNYPGTEPGLLMLTLAAELRFFAEPEAVLRFDRLDRLIADWHARIEEAERTHPADVPAIRAQRAGLVHAAFSEAVSALPRPTVVILDTTEELEKAAGGRANVEAALDVVSRLHEASPAVRVVLSGRRVLPLPDGAKELLVGGFSKPEAGRFVRWFDVDPKRANAIVARVAETAGGDELNPFDVALLANWAKDDPELSTAAIAAMDADFYVRHRIIDRLDDDTLEDMLPVIVALGRFDATTLGGVTGLQGAELDRLEASIAKQEWVSLEFDLMVVDPHLRARMMAYLDNTRRAAWTRARRQAASFLRMHCETSPRNAVTVEHVAGAIELTHDDDEVDLIEWWERIEERARAEAAFGWLQRITALLLGAQGAVGHDHALAGPVTASYVACLERESPDPVDGHQLLWAEVQTKSRPSSRAAARGAAHLPTVVGTAVEEWADRLDEQLAASFVSGLERVVPTSQDLTATTMRLYKAAIERDIGPELVAMTALLVGLAQARHGTKRESLRWLARAVELAEASVGSQQGNEWTDWPVDDVGARIRLTASWAWWQRFGHADEAAQWLTETGSIVTVDHDRESSLRAIASLATGHTKLPVTAKAPSTRARVPVHLQVPALAVSQAQARARSGDIDEALMELQDLATQPDSPEEYLMAERARMVIVRRYRLRDLGDGLSSGLADSGDPRDVVLLADLEAFDGDKVTVPIWERGPATPDPTLLHSWWRTVRAGGSLPTSGLLRSEIPTVPTTAADAHRALDHIEFAMLTGEPVPAAPALNQWLEPEGDDPETALRLALRNSVLTGRRAIKARRLADRLGVNHAAEVALDEGDSLSLRLPRAAAPMLKQAADWFAEADDAGGRLRASAAAAIAALHEPGSPPGLLAEKIQALSAAYELARPLIGLPPWDDLNNPTSDVLSISPRAWQAWVLRCIVVRAVGAGQTEESWLPTVGAIVGTRDAQNRLLLPAELSPLVGSHNRPTSWLGGSPASHAFLIPKSSDVSPVVLEIEGIAGSTQTQILRTGTVQVIRHDPNGDVRPAWALQVPSGRADTLALQALTAGLDEDTPVEILHSADVGAVSWETMLSSVAGSLPANWPIWRRLKRSTRRPSPTRHPTWPTTVLTGDPALAECWGNRATVLSTGLTRVDVPPALSTARVIHLIGSPVEERRGVAFPYVPSTSREREPASSRFATANELLSQWVNPELVIVQGPPDFELELDTWSREQAAYLRQLGSDFAQEGVPVVITLPGFQRKMWLDATRALTEALRLDTIDELTHDRLVRAYRAMQESLVARGGDRQVEDALGACLFISEALT